MGDAEEKMPLEKKAFSLAVVNINLDLLSNSTTYTPISVLGIPPY
jgi:hypothetical protein